MPKVHSHYENLKVARDASADEIRAAYRALTRKHHPDRNPDNADAQRVMSVVNVAYGVLSDAARRREHDRWIAQAEAEVVRAERPTGRPVRGRPTMHTPTARYQRAPTETERVASQRARQVLLERRVALEKPERSGCLELHARITPKVLSSKYTFSAIISAAIPQPNSVVSG